MRANTVWGCFGLAAALVITALTAAARYHQYFLAAAVAFFVAGVVALTWPFLFPSVILKKLTADERYMMATEGVALGRPSFGPFSYGDGCYGPMSWDRARVAVNRLIDL